MGKKQIMPKEEDGRTNFALRAKNRHYVYPFRVHDDDLILMACDDSVNNLMLTFNDRIDTLKL
jgi:hypothetical protein